MSEEQFGGLKSIRVSEDGHKIEIVNQLLLPHTTSWVEVTSVDDCHHVIKSMKIRGAPAIASAAALFFAAYISKALKQSPPPDYISSSSALKAHLDPLLEYVYTARPTAVNLGAATKRLHARLQSTVDADLDGPTAAQAFVDECNAIHNEDLGRNHSMSKWGAEWLQNIVGPEESNSGLNVLTVCNTGSLATSGMGTALGLITHLYNVKGLGMAYFTQTAPYHQGSRLTAFELKTLGIPSTMICDTMVGSLFQHRKIHAVAVGADRIARNGDTANKVGTYNAAVLAARHKIPFIVVAPIATVDLSLPDGSGIPIEQRPALEACTVRGSLYPPILDEDGHKKQSVVMITPEGLENVYNPAFDVTPAELITVIVTEKGVAVKKEGETSFDLSGVV